MGTIGFNNTTTQSSTAQKHPWKNDYLQEATIFGKHTFLPIDFGHARNDNTLVVGSSGTGKTYSFVEPNVLQGNANYVIADSKGTILSDVGASLKAMGYDIQVLNLLDLKHSSTYNPFNYFKNELDVVHFAEQVVVTDTDGETNHRDGSNGPFWNKAASTLIQAIIFFVQEFLPKEEQNMATVVKIFDMLDQKSTAINKVLLSLGVEKPEYRINGEAADESIGYLLFEYARSQNPNSLAVKNWDKLYNTQNADVTWGGITGMVGASLTQYGLNDVQDLMATNQLDFKRMLQPKAALFILYDDSNPTKNFISNSLYTQLFSYLYDEAYHYDEQKLPVKIRFYLDDFKNINIPNFADYLSTARSRNISICMMLQDESQLRVKYGAESPSIIGNCSAYLLTGTIDLQMAKEASERFDLSPREIRMMPEDNFLVDISGYVTKTKRYDYHDHPNYVDEKTNITDLFTTQSAEEIMDWSQLAHVLVSSPAVDYVGEEPYWKKARRMYNDAAIISNKNNDNHARLAAVQRLRQDLRACAEDENLDELTSMYRHTTAKSPRPNLGYDERQIEQFLAKFVKAYPKPDDE